LLKSVTFINLIKKVTSNKPTLTSWNFCGCYTHTSFFGECYSFYLPDCLDFNIYLNPYFHEYDITQFVFKVLSDGDIFVDVGAHGGLYTVLAAKRVGNGGKVFSFEPNPLNVKFLKLNVHLNNLENVEIIPMAVNNKEGRLKLFCSTNETALTSTSPLNFKDANQRIIQVDTTSLDELIKKVDFVKILKIDTEGNDYNVLESAKGLLNKTFYIIVEQNSLSVRRLLSKSFWLSTLEPSGYLLATNKLLK